MSILVVSEENLRFLKSILMKDYEVSSSHGSELIAALCGFNSYAAFKAKLDKCEFTPAVRINFDQFENRHASLGYDKTSGEWMRDSFNQLPIADRPWLMHKIAEKYLRDRWYAHCERNNIPFITIIQKNKYCYLEWDCISIDPKFEGHVRHENGDKLIDKLFQLYQLMARGNEPKSYFNGSAFYGNVTKIPPSLARQLANELFLKLSPWTLDQPNNHSHSIVPGGLLV